jgi:hypothetical protein
MDITPELQQKLRESPSLFVEKVLDIDSVYPYQREVLDTPKDRVAITGGRQIGKTTMMAWLAIHEFTMYADHHILLVAPTQRQALNFMRKLKAEIREWVDNPDNYGIKEVTKSRIIGKNGSRIEALPALEETIRGLTIDSAFVDEAAFIDRHIFTSVISPMLATTDGIFMIASTAWGKEGYLYSRFDNDEGEVADMWLTKQITSMENPDIPSTQIKEWRQDMTQMEFEREVLGQFTDKKNAFFKNRDINASLEWARDEDAPRNVVYPDRVGRTAYMGVDPATTGDDQAVLTSIDDEDNIFDIQTIDECEIPELEREIRSKINSRDRNYISVYIEENGLGEGTVHRFEEEFKSVEGFRTTIRSKESIYNQTKNKMQKGELNIPDREDLVSQLRTIEYENTNRGNMKIYAPEGNHDDMSDSMCLAVAAKSGDRYVERQKKFYSFQKSGNHDVSQRNKRRAYSFD